jgi:hypothetical protein
LDKASVGVASSLLRFSDFIPPKPGRTPESFYSLPVLVKEVIRPCLIQSEGCQMLLVVRRHHEPEDLRTLLAFFQ